MYDYSGYKSLDSEDRAVFRYEVWVDQDGKCEVCLSDIPEPDLFEFTTGTDGVIDHNHKTNKIRGLLCPTCNSGLGMFQDSTSVLYRAAEYLSKNRG